MNWLSYSANFSPYDYVLWGTLENIVYRNIPTILDELELSISEATESISVQTLQDAMGNFHFSSVSGGHFEQIVMQLHRLLVKDYLSYPCLFMHVYLFCINVQRHLLTTFVTIVQTFLQNSYSLHN